MSPVFNDYFKKLTGAWSLERKISTGETLNGKVVFERISDAAFFMREEGELILLNGSCISASRIWYWHLVDEQKLKITYDKNRQKEYHFLALSFEEGQWQGESDHLCGADHYLGNYKFSQNAFEVSQTIQGPNKNYSLTSYYIKVL